MLINKVCIINFVPLVSAPEIYYYCSFFTDYFLLTSLALHFQPEKRAITVRLIYTCLGTYTCFYMCRYTSVSLHMYIIYMGFLQNIHMFSKNIYICIHTYTPAYANIHRQTYMRLYILCVCICLICMYLIHRQTHTHRHMHAYPSEQGCSCI